MPRQPTTTLLCPSTWTLSSPWKKLLCHYWTSLSRPLVVTLKDPLKDLDSLSTWRPTKIIWASTRTLSTKPRHHTTPFSSEKPAIHPRMLFSTIKRILRPFEPHQPPGDPDCCSKFLDFFQAKVNSIYQQLLVPGTIIHAFITSDLDYCSGVLPGVLSKALQFVQIQLPVPSPCAKPLQHITLTNLPGHWLPIKFCNHYKILPLTYKSPHCSQYLSDLLHP